MGFAGSSSVVCNEGGDTVLESSFSNQYVKNFLLFMGVCVEFLFKSAASCVHKGVVA